ncbi:MAG: hypothetical protein A3F17_05645 [Gammaproteobacteria bacterium RIFCSPHIGHO2_12_FULL_41_15]|nr:MAG: hypothetical protein A3F17_05645 [Gammaproteobacteria bacterium RIFCSPHIGHO2_12_FULL_41_15]
MDIVFQLHDKLIPIEVKSTATFNPELLANIRYFQKLVGERAPFGLLVYTGPHEQLIDNIHVVNFRNLHAMLERVREQLQ